MGFVAKWFEKFLTLSINMQYGKICYRSNVTGHTNSSFFHNNETSSAQENPFSGCSYSEHDCC